MANKPTIEKHKGRFEWSVKQDGQDLGLLHYHRMAGIYTARRQVSREVTAGDLVGCLKFLKQ